MIPLQLLEQPLPLANGKLHMPTAAATTVVVLLQVMIQHHPQQVWV
jgi:hypothetical protein